MTPTLPALELQFRRDNPVLPTVDAQLSELFRFSRTVGEHSPLLRSWYLASDSSIEDALRYQAFDSAGPTTAAVAVVSTKTKGEHDLRSVSLWNGEEDDRKAASLSSRANVIGRPDSIAFSLTLQPEVTDWNVAAEWLRAALAIWPAKFATFGPFWYAEKKVFPDRPGASWMLYLPRVITSQQVPEARRLVPIFGADKKQTGTIILSVTDEPFSIDSPEHVKVANDIEVRLVDQDLLPRYADL